MWQLRTLARLDRASREMKGRNFVVAPYLPWLLSRLRMKRDRATKERQVGRGRARTIMATLKGRRTRALLVPRSTVRRNTHLCYQQWG